MQGAGEDEQRGFDGNHSVLFALFEGCLEAYIASPATDGVIHFKWAEETCRVLFGLCEEVVESVSPSVSEQFRMFLTELDSRVSDGEDNT